MQKPSKFGEGVQQFVLQGSVYCPGVLLLNLRVAFSDQSSRSLGSPWLHGRSWRPCTQLQSLFGEFAEGKTPAWRAPAVTAAGALSFHGRIGHAFIRGPLI
jgi:hypothetical protein